MTEKQVAFVNKLGQAQHVHVDTEGISKAQASNLIDALKSGRITSSSENQGATHADYTQTEATVTEPATWTTGNEPATSKQKAFIAVMEKRAGMDVQDMSDLTKSDASKQITALRSRTCS
ncbi:hypothetical protein BKA62DRAFT_706615 [Auriculariales sp. MPI-PUGE-AT-0066]|nr:hypothetical protein BKA62DRAFT_706615 [Auriculariales sp. MPI-PUGE-AT-0066]